MEIPTSYRYLTFVPAKESRMNFLFWHHLHIFIQLRFRTEWFSNIHTSESRSRCTQFYWDIRIVKDMRDFIKNFLRDRTKICPKRLNKKIKEVTISSCPPKTDKQYPYSKILFDIEGNKTEFKNYQSGKLITWEKYIYQDNKLIEILVGKSKWKSGSYNEKDFEFFTETVAFTEETGIVEVNEKGQKTISTFFYQANLKAGNFLMKIIFALMLLSFQKRIP